MDEPRNTVEAQRSDTTLNHREQGMFCHRCRLLKMGNNFHKITPLRGYRLFLIDSCPLGEENSRLLVWAVIVAGLLGLSGVLVSAFAVSWSDREANLPARMMPTEEDSRPKTEAGKANV